AAPPALQQPMKPRQLEVAPRPVLPVIVKEPRKISRLHDDLQALLRLAVIALGNFQEQIVGFDNESRRPAGNAFVENKIQAGLGGSVEHRPKVEPFGKQTHGLSSLEGRCLSWPRGMLEGKRTNVVQLAAR